MSNEPFHRYRLLPSYKANRNGGPPARKTDRRQGPRKPAPATPHLRVGFIMPASIAFALAPGLHRSGMEISNLNTASVQRETADRLVPFGIAAAFLQEVTPKGHPPYSVAVALTSSAEPGRDWWRLAYVDGHVFVARTSVEPMIFPGKV